VAFRDPVPAQDLAELARAEGWELEGSVAPTEAQAEEYVWRAGADLYVHWINDPVLHRVYAMIVGPDTAATERRVRAEFDAFTVAEAAAEFADAPDWPERVERLSVVAAAAPQEFDEGIFTAVAAALDDPHEVVRHKAVLAVFYARWEEFLPLLAPMTSDDPDDEVRHVAAVAVETIENPDAEPYPE
jgi:hypothetical protein